MTAASLKGSFCGRSAGSESPTKATGAQVPLHEPANTNLVPSRCYTTDQDFFHRDALLVEQLQDGDELTVGRARVYGDEATSPVSRGGDHRLAVVVVFSGATPRREYDAQNAKSSSKGHRGRSGTPRKHEGAEA